MEPIITTEQIFDSLEQAVNLLWNEIEPTIMPFIYDNIANAIVVSVVSLALFKIWKFINIDASARETKRVRRKIHDGVDVTFSFLDLFKKGK